jgi:hypothetical protein
MIPHDRCPQEAQRLPKCELAQLLLNLITSMLLPPRKIVCRIRSKSIQHAAAGLNF